MSYALGVVLAQPRLPRPDVVVGSSVHLPAGLPLADQRFPPGAICLRGARPLAPGAHRYWRAAGAQRHRQAAHGHRAFPLPPGGHGNQPASARGGLHHEPWDTGRQDRLHPEWVADFTPGIRSASGDAATLVQWIHDQRGACGWWRAISGHTAASTALTSWSRPLASCVIAARKKLRSSSSARAQRNSGVRGSPATTGWPMSCSGGRCLRGGSRCP